MSDDFEAEAHDLLRQLTGDDRSEFRPQQLEAIRTLVEDRGRVFLVQRTGWGKSAVYFIATRMLRDRGAGPTLLVSPLLALMRNQIAAAERMGVRAVSINSTNSDDWAQVQEEIDAGEVDVLLISPERLANEAFRRDVLPEVGSTAGLLVVDEVHCISDWGHDFRPDYQRIGRVLDRLPRGVPVVGCTATANDRVVYDVAGQLGDRLQVIRGSLHREGLRLHVLDLPAPAERMAWLATAIPRLGGSGIVYTLTVADSRRVADWLRSQGLNAAAYHAQLATDEKEDLELRLLNNEVDVVVATVALGMGFDKPDLCFVVHYQAPASPIAYYQQVGRAGRRLDESWGVLLRGREDDDIQDFFIENAFPPPDLAEELVAYLEEAGEGFLLRELEVEFNVRRKRLTHLLRTLDVEGAVEKVGSRWRRTLRPWSYDLDRAEAVTARRREEQEQMSHYASFEGCRMKHLRGLLDDRVDEDCGVCDRCVKTSLTFDLDRSLVAAAVEALRSGFLPIEPRKKWPDFSNIPLDHRLEEGRVLSRWGDGGWGDDVRRSKQEAGRFGDDLLGASVDLIGGRWLPDPAPMWVTYVPSTSSGDPVADFAHRLADRLGLPCKDVLERVRPGVPQKTMNNSTSQFGNVDGAFALEGPVSGDPVLLVDDVVDSRWTLTVVAAALRKEGSGPVYPFALADTSGRSA
ncbi:MAG: RecQ family ATP-dependent DNA helicase [Actinobacteria bacterium]|nr:RecQ family ATP-dependent DNA helicase [Actinomycetota bacterium]